jgi:hypothetical protein
MCWYWQPPQRWKYGHPALDFHAHHFARQHEGREDHLAAQTRQTIAAIHQLFDRQSFFHRQAKGYHG